MLEQVQTALDELIGQFDRGELKLTVDTRPLPVADHLKAAASSGNPATDMVLQEFKRVAPLLPWRQTAGYLDVFDSSYLDNYGYVQLIGPGSIVEHPSVRVGVGVWGPNLHYPMHSHEAEELYDVLSGEPSFTLAESPARATKPGDAVHNPPWQPHALDFGAAPTVLLYCWTGAVVGDAALL